MLLTLGDALMLAGARLAGGCTSGHVISGCALLNLPSLLAGARRDVGVCRQIRLTEAHAAGLENWLTA